MPSMPLNDGASQVQTQRGPRKVRWRMVAIVEKRDPHRALLEFSLDEQRRPIRAAQGDLVEEDAQQLDKPGSIRDNAPVQSTASTDPNTPIASPLGPLGQSFFEKVRKGNGPRRASNVGACQIVQLK